jgi:hopanoid C-3 methylase
VTTQRAILRKHLDWRQLWDASGVAARLLLRGQTNFVKSLFALNRVYRPELLLADHGAPVAYEIPLPPRRTGEEPPAPHSLYIHPPRGRKGRAIDGRTEQFVEATRIGASG